VTLLLKPLHRQATMVARLTKTGFIMTTNIGTLDRRLRIVAGIVLVLLPFLVGFDSGLAKTLSILVGVVLLGTAALNSCPIYSLLGFNSRSK